MTPVDLDQALARFARVSLITSPTPIQRLTRLEAALGAEAYGVQLFAKRDDHMELGGGGNKLRKLEYLLAAAQAQGADTVVTVGALQSNHARLTAAAAARIGLACEVFLTKTVQRTDDEYERSGNLVLDAIFGARVRTLVHGSNALQAAHEHAHALAGLGRRAYVIPMGGSTPLGCLGYVRCALEIEQQEQQSGWRFRQIVVPNGSFGTQAGLAAGFELLKRGIGSVRGYSVLADPGATRTATLELARSTLALLGHSGDVNDDALDLDSTHRGEGYGIPTPEMISAVKLLGANEGLLVDPVYSGKALAGLISDVQARRYERGDKVLFVMTGGTPGLYAYRSIFE
ncbi:D-cysteine desulfhydrase family protein [Variovorax sp. PvP013]|uniref:D-cysteine desulfhydrase family protein n=1 Tax=Variovorax sp. PvP013 TaxID=3156435 RepID=UPI003D206549